MANTFAEGQVVHVLHRQWPGSNKQGGVARVTKVNEGDNTLSVSYIIGDYKESGVDLKYIQPWDGVNTAMQSRSSSRSLRGARAVKAPKPFEEREDKEAATVAPQTLPDIPSGAPKFLHTQAKAMEQLLGRIENQDGYEVFRTERDPIDKHKRMIGDDSSGGEESEGAASRNIDTSAATGVTRGWMEPVCIKMPTKKVSPSPAPAYGPSLPATRGDSKGRCDDVGGWEHPPEKKRAARGGGRGGRSGGRGRERTAASRKRPRRGGDSTMTRRQPADRGDIDSPPPPPPPPPPPIPSPSPPRQRLAAEEGAPLETMVNAIPLKVREPMMVQEKTLPETSGGEAEELPKEDKEQEQRQQQQQQQPINLPQIRDRFVSGCYLPTADMYLSRVEESEVCAPDTRRDGSSVSASSMGVHKANGARTGSGEQCSEAVPKQDRKTKAASHDPDQQNGQETAPAFSADPAAVPSTQAGASRLPPKESEQAPLLLPEDRQLKGDTVGLTRDAGRLGPAAKLTFDYEPLMDWPALLRDYTFMVDRVLKAGADMLRTGGGRRERAGTGDGISSGDDTAEDYTRKHLEHATKFFLYVEESVSKAQERAEKERYALAVKRSVEDFTRKCEAAAMQGVLRTEPFPLRVYAEYLKEYKPARDLSAEDQEAIKRELKSSLKDGYLGQAYGYDDHGISEQWMKNYVGEREAQKQEAGQLSGAALRVQVNNLMENMCVTVVDRVNNQRRGVNRPSKDLCKYKIWGGEDGKTVVEVVDETQARGSVDGSGCDRARDPAPCGDTDAPVLSVKNDEIDGAKKQRMDSDRSENGSEVRSSAEAMMAGQDGPRSSGAREGLELGGQLEERSVWGIDCYTRTNVEHVLDLTLGLSKEQSRFWIRKTLLPALNRQRGPRGVDMLPALRDLCKVIPDGDTPEERRASQDRAQEEEFDLGPKAEGEHLVAAQALLHVIEGLASQSAPTETSLARAYFHCHPKGTGVICKDRNGIEADTFVSEYLGELYPAWRWCEKMDAVEEAKLKHGLKPELPDFYNIILERPREDARGYGLLYVDAGNHVGNFSSSLSHSCSANCTTATAVRNGKLCVTLTTTRAIAEGEELTMDYGAITSCETEYNKAVCLCGSHLCRQSFMTFTGTRNLHEVLRGFGPLMTFKTLVQSAADKPMNSDEMDALSSHGFKTSALGDKCPPWLKKFAAMQLRYVEYERRKLPPALLSASDAYTHQSADAEARAVMERRVQSLVDVLSSVDHFLQQQKKATSLLPTSAPSTPASASRRGGRRVGRKAQPLEGASAETDGASSRPSAPAAQTVAATMTSTATMTSKATMASTAGEPEDGNESSEALSEKPPLILLEDAQVIEALWTGKQSMMRRLMRRLEAVYAEKFVVDTAETSDDDQEAEADNSVAPAPRRSSTARAPARRRAQGAVMARERILVWDARQQTCNVGDAPPRDGLVEFLRARLHMEVYTGQGVPTGCAGEMGVRADMGDPRTPDDRIILWHAIHRRVVCCKDRPKRKDLASHLSTRPHLFLYAGQDRSAPNAWYGSKEARGVADAYAAAKSLPKGDPDEKIPLFNSTTGEVVMGDDNPTRDTVHLYLRTRPHMMVFTGQNYQPPGVDVPAAPSLVASARPPPPPPPPPPPYQPLPVRRPPAVASPEAQAPLESASPAPLESASPAPLESASRLLAARASHTNGTTPAKPRAGAPSVASAADVEAGKAQTEGAGRRPSEGQFNGARAGQNVAAVSDPAPVDNAAVAPAGPVVAGPSRRSISPSTVWIPLANGSPPKGLAAGAAAISPRVFIPGHVTVNATGGTMGSPPAAAAAAAAAAAVVEAGTSGAHENRNSLTPSPGLDVGTDDEPADRRAESALDAMTAAAAASVHGRFYSTEPARPDGWVARLQSGIDGPQNWPAGLPPPPPPPPTPSPPPTHPLASFGSPGARAHVHAHAHAAAAAAAAAAAVAAAAGAFDQHLANGGSGMPPHQQLPPRPVPLQEQLRQPAPWGLHVDHRAMFPRPPWPPADSLLMGPAWSALAPSEHGPKLDERAALLKKATHADMTAAAPADADAENGAICAGSGPAARDTAEQRRADSARSKNGMHPPAAAATGGSAAHGISNPWGLGFARQLGTMPAWNAFRSPDDVPSQSVSAGGGHGRERHGRDAGNRGKVSVGVGVLGQKGGSSGGNGAGGVDAANGSSSLMGGASLPPPTRSPSPLAGVDLAALAETLPPPSNPAIVPNNADSASTEAAVGAPVDGSSSTGTARPSAAFQSDASDGNVAGSGGGDANPWSSSRSVLGVRRREASPPPGGRVEGVGGPGPAEYVKAEKKIRARGGTVLKGRGGAMLKKQKVKKERIVPGEAQGVGSEPLRRPGVPSGPSGTSAAKEGLRTGSPGAAAAAAEQVGVASVAIGASPGDPGVEQPANGKGRGGEAKSSTEQLANATPSEGDKTASATGTDTGKSAGGLASATPVTPSRDGAATANGGGVVGRAATKEELARVMSEGHPDDRISMWDPVRKKTLIGKRAPQRKRLDAFCQRNPLLQFYAGQSSRTGRTPTPSAFIPPSAPNAKKMVTTTSAGGTTTTPTPTPTPTPRSAPSSTQAPPASEGTTRDKGRVRPLTRKAFLEGQEAIKEIRTLLESEVPHRGVLKRLLLTVRKILLRLRPLPNARHTAAADVVLLLAHTKTFAEPTTYAQVTGDPVQVLAKELGNNVPRAVLKRYLNDKKSAAKRAAAAAAVTAVSAEAGTGVPVSGLAGPSSPTFALTPNGTASHGLSETPPRTPEPPRSAGAEQPSPTPSSTSIPPSASIGSEEVAPEVGASVTPAASPMVEGKVEGFGSGALEDDKAEAREDGTDGGGTDAESTARAASAATAATPDRSSLKDGALTAANGCSMSTRAGGASSKTSAAGPSPAGVGRASGAPGKSKGRKAARGKRCRSKKIVPPRPPARQPAPKQDNNLKGDEVVHEYTPVCGPHYVLAQLMQWHNHGEGGNPNQPFDHKLRGCVRLPDVLEAYEGEGTYDEEQRRLLLDHLVDPDLRKHPWPAKLDTAFGIEDPDDVSAAAAAAPAPAPAPAAAPPASVASGNALDPETKADATPGENASVTPGDDASGGGGIETVRARSARGARQGRCTSRAKRNAGFSGKGGSPVGGITAGVGGMILLGNPLVDATLDDTSGLRAVIETMKQEMGQGGATLALEEDGPQSSNRTPWAQCDKCKKWRRMPWHRDPDRLGETWFCSMNDWDPDLASCDIPEEKSHEDADQISVFFSGPSVVRAADFRVGMWLDVFSVRLRSWFPAKVVAMEEHRVLVHYNKRKRVHDEWLMKDDQERIQRVHTHTRTCGASAKWLGLLKNDSKSVGSESGSDGETTASETGGGGRAAVSAAKAKPRGSGTGSTTSASFRAAQQESDFLYYGPGGSGGKKSMSREERSRARRNRVTQAPDGQAAGEAAGTGAGVTRKRAAPEPRALHGAAKKQRERKMQAEARAAAAAAAAAGNPEIPLAVGGSGAASLDGGEEAAAAAAVQAAAQAAEHVMALMTRGEVLIARHEAETTRSILSHLATAFHPMRRCPPATASATASASESATASASDSEAGPASALAREGAPASSSMLGSGRTPSSVSPRKRQRSPPNLLRSQPPASAPSPPISLAAGPSTPAEAAPPPPLSPESSSRRPATRPSAGKDDDSGLVVPTDNSAAATQTSSRSSRAASTASPRLFQPRRSRDRVRDDDGNADNGSSGAASKSSPAAAAVSPPKLETQPQEACLAWEGDETLAPWSHRRTNGAHADSTAATSAMSDRAGGEESRSLKISKGVDSPKLPWNPRAIQVAPAPVEAEAAATMTETVLSGRTTRRAFRSRKRMPCAPSPVSGDAEAESGGGRPSSPR